MIRGAKPLDHRPDPTNQSTQCHRTTSTLITQTPVMREANLSTTGAGPGRHADHSFEWVRGREGKLESCDVGEAGNLLEPKRLR